MLFLSVSRGLARARNSAVLTNTVATILVKGSTVVSRLIVLLVLARALPPAEYGAIVVVLSIVEITRQIADFGMDIHAMREFSALGKVSQQRAFASRFGFARLILGTTAYLFLLGLMWVTAPSRTDRAAVLGVLVISGLWVNYALDYYQGHLRVKVAVAPVIAANAITIILLIVLLTLPNVPVLLVLSMIPIAELVVAALLLRRLNKELPVQLWKSDLAELGVLLRLCAPIAITSIIVIVYSRLDILLLNQFTTAREVGYYSAAARLIDPFSFVAMYLSLSIYSSVSAALVHTPADADQRMKQGLAMLVAYGVLACLFIEFAISPILPLVLPAYGPSLSVLRLLAIGLAIRTVNFGLTSLIQAHGQFAWITGVALWNLLFIVACFLILLPIHGIEGAALALLIGEAVNTAIQLVLLRQARRQNHSFAARAHHG